MQETPWLRETVGEPAVVVFETRPRWTPELQRQFACECVRVRACGTWSDVRRRLAESGDSLLVLDLAVGAADALRYLGRQIGATSRRPVVVITDRRSADLEWSLRELGTVQVFTDDLSGEELADFCRRIWRRKQRQTDD